jgi:hypothetical protein
MYVKLSWRPEVFHRTCGASQKLKTMVGYVKIVGCTTIMAQLWSTSGLQDSLTWRAPEIKTRHIY